MNAGIAQSVERRTENPCVGGSIPSPGILFDERLRLVVTFLLWLLLPILFSCGKKPETGTVEIRIGFYGPLTGNMASFGRQTKQGIDLAISEANKTGKGPRILLFSEDDRGNPEEAQSAVTKLITKYRVMAILGEPSSSGSLAGAPVCQRNGVPMVTPTATNPKVTEAGDCIFRVCWIDPFQGEVMARFGVSNIKAKRFGILFDVSSDYSTGLSEVFENTVRQLGGEIVKRASYSLGDTDFSAQLTAIHVFQPDAIYVPGYYNEAGLIVLQARKMGITSVLLGGDGWDSPSLWEVAGEALDNAYFCTHFFPGDPNSQSFVPSFQKQYGEIPSAGGALGYDAANLLLQAIRSAGKLEPSHIRNAIADIRDFKGVTGTIRFDSKRNAVKPAIVLRLDRGKASLAERISP